MKSHITPFAAGLLTGLVLTMVLTWQFLPHLMIQTHQSRFSVDDTIAVLSRAAREQGWVVPKVYDMQGSLAAKGFTDFRPMKIVSLCQPHHASQVLAQDDDKRLVSIMPCRLGIYETGDGQVYVAGMNIGLMSRMFGSEVAQAMQQASADEEAMLQAVIR